MTRGASEHCSQSTRKFLPQIQGDHGAASIRGFPESVGNSKTLDGPVAAEAVPAQIPSPCLSSAKNSVQMHRMTSRRAIHGRAIGVSSRQPRRNGDWTNVPWRRVGGGDAARLMTRQPRSRSLSAGVKRVRLKPAVTSTSERGVHAASPSPSERDPYFQIPSRRRSLKRPEGRAPARHVQSHPC